MPQQLFPIASDLNATWSFIQPGLEFILGAQGDQGVTSKMYMNCYTAIYNYCTTKSRNTSTSISGAGAGGTLSSGGNNNSSYSLAGAEIYSKLEEYLVSYILSLKKNPNETFLEFYVKKWTRFTIGAGYMNNIFDYMNRYWVQKERSDGRRDVFDVNTLSLLKWKFNMFNNYADQLIDEVLISIEKQRNNEIVETNLISVAIKSLVYLGIDVQDLKKPNLVVYIKFFEQRFLDSTASYYSKESQNYLSQHNVVDYMKKCETRLGEEISRSNNYLEEHTKKLLLETLHNALIKDHAQEMYSQFLRLLEQNEIDHIQRMYKLLSRVPSTLEPLADTFEKYIKEAASKAIEEIKKSSDSSTDNKASNEASNKVSRRSAPGVINPRIYVHTLVNIYYKFREIIVSAFNKDPIFIKSLDNACSFFVNHNSIATPTPKSACKTPDLLAKYADGFLKATGKEETDDMNSDHLMVVLKFINDKDTFEEHYRRLLAKRLINSNTKSDELEEGVIQRLQDENSLEYTSKMTKMFQDMKASGDLKVNVKEALGADNTVKDFTPLVLAQSMWPFKYMEEYQLNLAPELKPAFDKVEEVYTKQHNGRQLQWLWNHGKSEVKANISRKGKPPFLFTVTNTQLVILLAFNKQSSYTFKELHEIVGNSRKTFEAHLLPFTKYKLLEQLPSDSDSFNQDNTRFTIVEEYSSKKLKVNFVSSIKTEQKQEEDDANKEIDESRKNYLSASIVRIMKARKKMKNNDLINEVIVQAQARFRAKIIDIKKVIDFLMEKEYIRRCEQDTYEYVA